MAEYIPTPHLMKCTCPRYPKYANQEEALYWQDKCAANAWNNIRSHLQYVQTKTKRIEEEKRLIKLRGKWRDWHHWAFAGWDRFCVEEIDKDYFPPTDAEERFILEDVSASEDRMRKRLLDQRLIIMENNEDSVLDRIEKKLMKHHPRALFYDYQPDDIKMRRGRLMMRTGRAGESPEPEKW